MDRLTIGPMRLAVSFRTRMQGLLRESDSVLLLAPCCDIHTFGMRGALDVAFVDSEGVVLKAYRGVSTCRRLRCKGACAALERYARDDPWLSPGQRVCLAAETKEERKGQ